jgi:hypothetical protein
MHEEMHVTWCHALNLLDERSEGIQTHVGVTFLFGFVDQRFKVVIEQQESFGSQSM